MSEPARHTAYETASRQAGPLRDWLASMKAHVPAAQPEPRQAAPELRETPRQPELRQAVQRQESPRQEISHQEAPRPEPVRAEPPRAAGPRLVQPAQVVPRVQAETDEVSELMAENLMLKAKLRIENERHGELQALLAQEIRELRQHVHQEMATLHDVRDQRDQLHLERDALRTGLSEAQADLDGLESERDLWKARCETLAGPLFQKR